MRNPQVIRHELEAAKQRVKELVWELEVAEHPLFHHLLTHAEAVDLNWLRLCAVSEGGELDIWVNGPKHGDVSLNITASRLIPDHVLRVFREQERREVTHNPRHHLELIPYRTGFSFENCDDGYVCSVDGDRCTLVGPFGGECEYTWEEIAHDLALEESELRCKVDAVYYFPCRFPWPTIWGKRVLQTPQDLDQRP